MGAAESELKESVVTFRTSQGLGMRAGLLRLTRYAAVVEVYSPGIVIRTSDVLDPFRIANPECILYSGRALVSNVVNTGTLAVCEVKLDEAGLNVTPLSTAMKSGLAVREQFDRFISQWQSSYRIVPEFKDVIGDMQSFLSELHIWLEQLELEIRSSPTSERQSLEREVIDELAPAVIRGIDSFVERFEGIVRTIDPELQPIYRAYLRRQLHPFILCSPFAYRAFQKPLGYAGDYETVQMMLRPPYEGSTLFAKLINVWLLDQAPARAHRNRVEYLESKLTEAANRARMENRIGRVYNLGCGAATEVQRFIERHPEADRMEFTLVDFNQETLEHVMASLEATKRQESRSTVVRCVQRSVQSVIKDSAKSGTPAHEPPYQLVYCAGLFDYLSDAVCKRLMSILYELLAPGGFLLATNVSAALNDSRPFRFSMEYMLDWHLVYRTGTQVRALIPERAPADLACTHAEETGTNVFLEIRKPNHA